MKFCPTCKYHLYLMAKGEGSEESDLRRVCKNCGYTEVETEGGLILETMIQERSSEAFKIMINEFTRQDKTLPHMKMLPCAKESCPTNLGGAERDVIYMTYDAAAKRNLYICNVCGEQWKSRN